MNNKGNESVKSYVAVFVVMLVALVVIFVLLEMAKSDRKAKPLGESNGTTTTTKLTTTHKVESDVPENENKETVITNFSEPLLSIISKSNFYGDYKIDVNYNGIDFNFNCTAFDESTENCISGSGLMNINNHLIPLYTYSNENDNYIKRPMDFYITVDDNYISITRNNVGFASGETKIYDRDGYLQGVVKNVITGYRKNGKIVSMLYPNITDNIFNYYVCNNNVVEIAYVDISNIENITIDEVVDGVSCY